MAEWIQLQQTIGAVLITAMVTVTLITWAACLLSGVLKKKKKKSKPLYVTEILDFEAEVKAAEERREKLIEDWKEGKI
jgi:hypothetical protein